MHSARPNTVRCSNTSRKIKFKLDAPFKVLLSDESVRVYSRHGKYLNFNTLCLDDSEIDLGSPRLALQTDT